MYGTLLNEVADEWLTKNWSDVDRAQKIMDYHDVKFPGGMSDEISRWV